ncbi:MAG: glutaredoxin family protein [Halioglobus sp.]
MKHLILYGTSACHLCEEAEAILQRLQQGGLAFTFEKVDIALDDALFAAYGLTIPVIRTAEGAEENWPFSADAVAALLGR